MSGYKPSGFQAAIKSVLDANIDAEAQDALASGDFGERPVDEAQPAIDYIRCRWANFMVATGGSGLWCPHEPERFPEMFWSPVAPGIMCPRCLGDFLRSLSVAQDHTCDVCGIEKDHAEEWGISHIWIGAYPYGEDKVMPPLSIMFGICLGCYAKIMAGEITCQRLTRA